jgi:hypothetical protein
MDNTSDCNVTHPDSTEDVVVALALAEAHAAKTSSCRLARGPRGILRQNK